MRGVAGIGANIFGQAEVEHLDAAFARDHDVGGLQVAMNDALIMGGGERVAECAGDIDDLLDREPAVGDHAVEWQTFDQLHGQEVNAVAFFDRIDGDDVRMVELCERLCLAPKAAETLGILRHFGGQYFKSHVAAKLGVGGAIHLAHAASA